MRLGFIIALFLTAFVAAWTPGLAQTADPRVTFEVASVKPAGPFVPGTQSGMRGGPGTDDPGRLTWPRATLSSLLTQAYDVLPDQISGPAWLSDGLAYAYSINASIPTGTTRDQFRLMLRDLLMERFHVSFHHETQTRPGYELVLANGGPKLKEWTPSTAAAPAKLGVGANGFPTLPAGSTAAVVTTSSGSGRPASVRMTFRESIAAFCRGLGAQINRANGGDPDGPQPHVADKTGLTGIYEFTLEYAATLLMPGAMPPAPPADNAGMPAASDPGEGLPNIFTAVEKQLGLKLMKVKDVQVDVLIVDGADKIPTEN
jgi:uncharacterized protein (TIGR03435 family)